MAQGIQDLGNGIGYLYKSLSNGSTIVGVERNTTDGVRAMQQMGVTNAPVVAARSAVGVITVTSSGGVGSITSINILAVNQIAAPIVVTSTTPSVVAQQIATAINSFSPGGYVFTATAQAANVYVFSTPQDGATINGATITVAVTNPGIVINTTDFVNGSSQVGVYDTVFGYRFFIDADYNGLASPNTIGVKAVDITQYITVRGSQSGIITVSKSVSTDRLTGITRACDTTQVILDTQSSAATDICAFIQVTDFAEGDTLRIRGADPTRVVTLEDATNTTSPIPTPNIYLANAVPFSLDGLSSITLQYRYDPTLGPIWVETGRTTSVNAPITTTLVQFVADAGASALLPDRQYFISDLNDGVYVNTITSSSYDPRATLIRKVPYNYSDTWRVNMTVPTINNYYRYYQNVYQSLTGAIGTAPSVDAINWQLVPTSNAAYYTSAFNSILLANSASELSTWPIIEERDQNDNIVIQSRTHRFASGVNAFSVFPWNTNIALSYGNYVCDSVFDAANVPTAVYGNIVIQGSNFINNVLGTASALQRNYFSDATITGNYVNILTGNYVYQSSITNNGALGGVFGSIYDNTLYGGSSITGNVVSGASSFIRGNTLKQGSQINNNAFQSGGYIYACELSGLSKILNSTLKTGSGGISINAATLTNSADLTFVMGPSIVAIRYSTFNGGTYVIADTNVAPCSVIEYSIFNNCDIQYWPVFGAVRTTFTNCNWNAPAAPVYCLFTDSVLIGWNNTVGLFDHTGIGGLSNVYLNYGVSSNLSIAIDLDDPVFFAANILTFPNYLSIYSTFDFIAGLATPAFTINQVVNLPSFPVVTFYNATGGGSTVTFNKVAPGAWSGNLIVGAANFTMNSNASGTADYMTMTKYLSSVNMITGGVNFV